MLGNYTPPTDERITRDLVALARGRLAIANCPSGRPTIKNQPCAHCGVDFTDDVGFCGQPLDEDGYTPFDATVARRIMADSARNNGETE